MKCKFFKVYQWMFNLKLTHIDILVYAYLLSWREYYDNNSNSLNIEITRRSKDEILNFLKISTKSFHNSIEKLYRKRYVIKWDIQNCKKLYSATFPPKSIIEYDERTKLYFNDDDQELVLLED